MNEAKRERRAHLDGFVGSKSSFLKVSHMTLLLHGLKDREMIVSFKVKTMVTV